MSAQSGQPGRLDEMGEIGRCGPSGAEGEAGPPGPKGEVGAIGREGRRASGAQGRCRNGRRGWSPRARGAARAEGDRRILLARSARGPAGRRDTPDPRRRVPRRSGTAGAYRRRDG